MLKKRLDALLVERGYYETREKAKAAIMAGLVRLKGEMCDKPGTKVAAGVDVEIAGPVHPYVSRGGLKLEKALDVFQYDMRERVVIDVGASTGGFTDCALQNGARHVYAVDVGYGQLAWKLRQDPRVTVMERTNFRYVTAEDFLGPRPDVAVIDVSFISLEKILPPLSHILHHHGAILSLIKPQFEAGKALVGKNGVVRDAAIHQAVLNRTLKMAAEQGFLTEQLTYSPITGGKGNIEFLVHWNKESSVRFDPVEIACLVDAVVTTAHSDLT